VVHRRVGKYLQDLEYLLVRTLLPEDVGEAALGVTLERAGGNANEGASARRRDCGCSRTRASSQCDILRLCGARTPQAF